MILDTGILKLLRVSDDGGKSGNMTEAEPKQYYTAWYGERTVGMSRYYAAQQANTRIDKVVRIRSGFPFEVRADDIAILKDGGRYRVIQAQTLKDEDAGCTVIDISLERIGYRDGNNT